MRRAFALALALTSGGALTGCLSDLGPKSCDRSKEDNPPLVYVDGVAENGVYTSWPADCASRATAPTDCELLYFPGGARYEIEHHLGVTPLFWKAYLSFNQYGTRDTGSDPDAPERGTLAEAAGNQVELVDMNDHHLTVANGSCSAYWLLVMASAGSAPPGLPAGAGGGGAGGGASAGSGGAGGGGE